MKLIDRLVRPGKAGQLSGRERWAGSGIETVGRKHTVERIEPRK